MSAMSVQEQQGFVRDCEFISSSVSFKIVIDSAILEYLNIIHLHAENEEQAQFARDAINVIIKLEDKFKSYQSETPSEMTDEDRFSTI